MRLFKFLKSIFNFREQKKQLLHIILISFLGSFAAARLCLLLIGGSIYIEGYHIHHFYFGMLVLSVGGVIGLISSEKKLLRVASALVGIGIGLFIDEIGLLLNCTTANRECIYNPS